MVDFSLSVFLEELKALCAIDSGQGNGPGAEAMADYFEERFRALGLVTERRYAADGRTAPMLLAGNGDGREIDALFVAHLDTVFPDGTGAKRPLTVDEAGVARGPGVVDCKGGCLLVYYLVRALLSEGDCPFRFLAAFSSDEERSSLHSRACYEELAQRTRYCFVFEPGRANDEFVSCRKGDANYLIQCHGVAAHAGVDPEKGASAVLELARWVDRLYTLTDYPRGTTLNVGRFTGGSDGDSVPDYAECTLSFRYLDPGAMDELRAFLRRMEREPFDPRTRMEIIERSLRPVMAPHAGTEALLQELAAAGKELGQPVEWVTTGGCSDGNFIAHYGPATLDGCGPCGAALHTENEYLKTATVERRLMLMRALLARLFPNEASGGRL